MATITNIQPPTAQRLETGAWRLSVRYTVSFSQFEVDNFHYRDSVQVREDDPLRDDTLTGWRNVDAFNPSARLVNRTKATIVNGDTLDTEIGAEEIYLTVRLENTDLNTPPVTRSSPNINIAP